MAQTPSPNLQHVSRRNFLRTTGAVAAGALALPLVLPGRARGQVSANERLSVGFIGTGGRGMWLMNEFLNQPDTQVVAVCDVDAERGGQGREPARRAVDAFYSQRTGQAYTGTAAYNDYRELLARDDLDAVCIATPDHWHALTTVAACAAGLDVYCEKPLANSVGEGRAMVDAAQRFNRVLQCGSHERSTNSIRYACELVRNGFLGQLRTIRIHLPTTDGHHIEARNFGGIPAPEPVPPGFDYDLWLGHTAEVPHTPRRTHFWWRFNLAYGGGEMTDRGAHVIDIGQLGAAKDDTGPVRLEAGGVRDPNSLYNTFWDYNFHCTYADGLELIGSGDEPRGLRFEGDDGWIFVHIHGGALEAEPASLLQEAIPDDGVQLGRSPGHVRNFLDCVHTRAEPLAPGEAGHRTASLCHLLNIAMLTEEALEWDPQAERCRNSDLANRLLMPPMRAPWQV